MNISPFKKCFSGNGDKNNDKQKKFTADQRYIKSNYFLQERIASKKNQEQLHVQRLRHSLSQSQRLYSSAIRQENEESNGKNMSQLVRNQSTLEARPATGSSLEDNNNNNNHVIHQEHHQELQEQVFPSFPLSDQLKRKIEVFHGNNHCPQSFPMDQYDGAMSIEEQIHTGGSEQQQQQSYYYFQQTSIYPCDPSMEISHNNYMKTNKFDNQITCNNQTDSSLNDFSISQLPHIVNYYSRQNLQQQGQEYQIKSDTNFGENFRVNCLESQEKFYVSSATDFQFNEELAYEEERYIQEILEPQKRKEEKEKNQPHRLVLEQRQIEHVIKDKTINQDTSLTSQTHQQRQPGNLLTDSYGLKINTKNPSRITMNTNNSNSQKHTADIHSNKENNQQYFQQSDKTITQHSSDLIKKTPSKLKLLIQKQNKYQSNDSSKPQSYEDNLMKRLRTESQKDLEIPQVANNPCIDQPLPVQSKLDMKYSELFKKANSPARRLSNIYNKPSQHRLKLQEKRGYNQSNKSNKQSLNTINVSNLYQNTMNQGNMNNSQEQCNIYGKDIGPCNDFSSLSIERSPNSKNTPNTPHGNGYLNLDRVSRCAQTERGKQQSSQLFYENPVNCQFSQQKSLSKSRDTAKLGDTKTPNQNGNTTLKVQLQSTAVKGPKTYTHAATPQSIRHVGAPSSTISNRFITPMQTRHLTPNSRKQHNQTMNQPIVADKRNYMNQVLTETSKQPMEIELHTLNISDLLLPRHNINNCNQQVDYLNFAGKFKLKQRPYFLRANDKEWNANSKKES